MPDLSSAMAALDKIPDVLGIRYTESKKTCIIRVLRDTPEVHASIAKVMARYEARYTIELVARSSEHIEAVGRLTEEARTAAARRGPRVDRGPAHAHRQRRGGRT